MLLPAYVVMLFAHLFMPPPVHLHYGPDTTVLMGPRHADGTIDYLKALNQRTHKGVTRENNAFVTIAETMPPPGAGRQSAWPDDKTFRPKMFHRLGLKRSEAGPYFTGFDQVVRRAGAAEEKAETAQSKTVNEPWTNEDHPLVARWLKTNAPAMARIREASRKPRYDAPLIPDSTAKGPAMMSALMPYLGYEREVARAFAAHAERAVQAGDLKQAWADVLVLKRLARLVPQQPILIPYLVGISLDAYARHVVRDIAASPAMTPALAKSILRDMRELGSMPSMAPALNRGERFMGLDAVQHLWASGARLREIGLREPAGMTPKSGFGSPYFNVNVPLRAFNAWYDRLVRLMKVKDFAVYQKLRDKMGKSLAHRGQFAREFLTNPLDQALLFFSSAKTKQAVISRFTTNLLVATLLPALQAAANTVFQDRMGSDLGRVAIALGGYRAAHGRYPGNLRALTPGFLSRVPEDLFIHKPLHYRHEPAGSKTAGGGGVVVYSVGKNQKDDGGKGESFTDGDIIVRLPPPK